MTICKLKELFLFCLNQTALPDMQIKGEKEQLCGIFFAVSKLVLIFAADFVRIEVRADSKSLLSPKFFISYHTNFLTFKSFLLIMRKFTFSFKTLLLLASMLIGGGNCVWATDYTETYNFDGGISDVTFSPSSISYTNSGSSVYIPSNCDALKQRFAFDDGKDSWNNYAWSINDKAGGLRRLSSSGRFSVLDLQVGDKITITLNGSYPPSITFKSANASAGETQVSVDDALVSGTEYTITEAGQLDFYISYNSSSPAYRTIESVTIVSQKQSLSRPKISVEPQIDSKTKITITPGSIRGNASGSVVTRYSTSSLSADKTSGTEYTDPLEQTSDGTIYAYSYVDAADGLASVVVSKAYEVVEYTKTKVIDFTSLGHEGLTSGTAWSTTLHGIKAQYPTWQVYNTNFIPELTYGNNYMQFVSSYNYLGNRNSSSNSITIDDLETDQIAKLVKYDNSGYDIQYGINGSRLSVSGWGVFRALEYYTPSSETVALSVGEAGLATYMGSYTIDLTGDTKIAAYRATVSGSTVTLTKVTTVPAGEPVLLRSLEGGAANTTVPVATYSAWDASDNAFVGAYTEKTVNQIDGDYTNFVLSKEEDVVGFFKAETEANGGTTVGAGKAYLPVNTSTLSAKALRIVVDGETTEVVAPAVVEAEEDGVLYNVAGQIVGKDYKGIVITKSGKKYFNK